MQKRIASILIFIFLTLNGCNTRDQKVEPIPAASKQVTAEPSESHLQIIITTTPDPENHYGIIRVPSQVDDMIGNLSNIPIGVFYERSFIYWLSRDPEKITFLGLTDYFSEENGLLTNLSERYILETEKLENSILSRLESYDRSLLDVDEQLNYDIYHWFWKDMIDAQPFRLMRSPIQSYQPESVQSQFINLMVNYHPLNSELDVINYISRINQIYIKIEQLIDQMKLREENGIIPPRLVLTNAIAQTRSYIPNKISDQYVVEESILFTHLQDTLMEREFLNSSKEYKYLNQLKKAIKDSFIPAYINLANYLEQIIEISDDQIGLYHYTNGNEFYDQLINHYSGSNFTSEQITEFSKEKINQDFDQLLNFLPQIQINLDDFNERKVISAKESQNQFIQIYTQFPSLIYAQKRIQSQANIISILSERLSISERFSINHIGIEQTVNPVSKENFLVNDPWIEITNSLMIKDQKIDTSLVFSKSVSEILDQLLLAEIESNLQNEPLFRKVLIFPGYSERLQAIFVDDILANSSFISQWEKFSIFQRNLFLSACLQVDTGIHKYGWTIGESKDFLEKSAGLPSGSTQMIVERIIQNPGQVSIYVLGNYQMQSLVGQVKERLREKFDQKDFNDWLVSKGQLPFPVLETQIMSYISSIEKMDSNNIQP